MENSYRATILAFLDEWSLFAERNGVDISKVIKAIKVRPTHSNMIFPGPGIGGYCLPKDGGLGVWAYKHILGFEDDIFKITPMAIDINDTRSLHAAQLVRDALRNMSVPVAGAEVLLSAPPTARTWATPATAAPRSWSAGSPRWAPRSASTTPTSTAGGSSRSRTTIPSRQGGVLPQPEEAQGPAGPEGPGRGAEGLRRPGPRRPPRSSTSTSIPTEIVAAAGQPIAVIDCFGILDDDRIRRYFELGCEVKGLGRGHIQRIKDQVRRKRMITKGPGNRPFFVVLDSLHLNRSIAPTWRSGKGGSLVETFWNRK